MSKERILFVGGPLHGMTREVVAGAQVACVAPAYDHVQQVVASVAEVAYRRAEALIKVPGQEDGMHGTLPFIVTPGLPIMLCEAERGHKAHALTLQAVMIALGVAKVDGS